MGALPLSLDRTGGASELSDEPFEHGMRELKPQDDLLLVRDTAPVIYVPAATWHCMLCDPEDKGPVATTTVVWLGANTSGPHGRCSSCGQKFELATMGEAVPPPGEQRWPR